MLQDVGLRQPSRFLPLPRTQIANSCLDAEVRRDPPSCSLKSVRCVEPVQAFWGVNCQDSLDFAGVGRWQRGPPAHPTGLDLDATSLELTTGIRCCLSARNPMGHCRWMPAASDARPSRDLEQAHHSCASEPVHQKTIFTNRAFCHNDPAMLAEDPA